MAIPLPFLYIMKKIPCVVKGTTAGFVGKVRGDQVYILLCPSKL